MFIIRFEYCFCLLQPKPCFARMNWWHESCHRNPYHTLLTCEPCLATNLLLLTHNNLHCSIFPGLSSSEILCGTYLRQFSDPCCTKMGIVPSPTCRQIKHIPRTNRHTNRPTQVRELSRILVWPVRVPDSARHLD